MSAPTTTGKHAAKAVIEPATVIQERQEHGLKWILEVALLTVAAGWSKI